MHPRWLIFATLIGIHGSVFVFTPNELGPLLVRGSIFLPLRPLEALGIQVWGAGFFGVALPSSLGWAVVCCFWSAIWFAVATFLSRRLSWLIFATLIGIHGSVVVFGPNLVTPLVMVSIFLPLWPLEVIGIPVMPSDYPMDMLLGSWVMPTPLGWAVVCCLWSAIWFAVAMLLSRLFTKRAGHA